MDRRQDTRLLFMNTPLGKDRLFLASLSGTEALSRLFHYTVRAFATNSPVELDQIVGQPVVVSVAAGETPQRHFHGHVQRMALESHDPVWKKYFYIIELVPWFWFLTRRQDCRIFQEKSVVEIAEEIFQEFGFTDYSINTFGSYPPRTYCVQYRETSFNFLTRLFEEEGIYYFFRHEEGRHVLVLGDSPEGHPDCPDQPEATFAPLTQVPAPRAVTDWREAMEIRPGRAALGDFNFETPKTDLHVNVDTLTPLPATADLEIFDYPGRYDTRDRGETLVRRRMEAHEATQRTWMGQSTCPGLTAGHAFTLKDHPIGGYNNKYTLLEVQHVAENNWEGERHVGGSYTNQAVAITNDVTFRPPVVTPKPIVEGPQTAIVVGPSGEEIHVDKYGRVKVRFHWDRRSQSDETSSCWIRASQSWAGARWGAATHPRIGMEVIISFLEGDPDRPLLTGHVNNADNMPPYGLPDHRTRTTLRTNSSKGGGGFNELRFEDKKGEEEIFVRGERDLNTWVKNTAKTLIHNESHLTVKKDRFEHTEGDEHALVKGDRNEKVDGTLSTTVAMDHHEKVSMNLAVDSGLNMGLKAGVNMCLEAGASLTLKCGASFINITPATIAISAPMLLLNSGGSAGSGPSASPETPEEAKKPGDSKAGEKMEVGQAAKVQIPKGDRGKVTQIAVMREAAANGTPFCEKCSGGGG